MQSSSNISTTSLQLAEKINRECGLNERERDGPRTLEINELTRNHFF